MKKDPDPKIILEGLHRQIASALGELNFMLAKRRLNRAKMLCIAEQLRAAAAEIEKFVDD